MSTAVPPSSSSPDASGRHLFASPSRITPADRERLLGQRGVTLWFSGLSGSGKSTIALALEQALFARGHLAYILDGDNIRLRLNRDLGFTDADREENLRRVAEVAHLVTECGVICLSAFISPLRVSRARAREIIGADRFLEVHVSTDLAECERRDIKGLYRKARAGEIAHFTGINSPFEPPENPDITLDTSALPVEESVARLLALLDARGFLSAG
jgi:adenylylsulfate kinase